MASEKKESVQDSYWDKYNIPRVPLDRALRHLDRFIRQGRTRGVFCFISEAGEGKTQGIQQVARKHEYRVVDFRTANFSLMGAGVPQRAEDGFFQIAVPEYMPRAGEKTVLLFDEVNQGQQHAISMIFPLIEDRLFFNYKLPKDTIIVLAMNPATAQYAVSKIETNRAFNRRLKKFYVYTPFEVWAKHARSEEFHYSDGMEKPCHTWVMKFLGTARNMLYTTKDAEKNMQFCCPATWQTVSRDLYDLEADGVDIKSDECAELVASSIGVTNAKALIEYIRNNEIRIAPEEILEKYKANSNIRKRVNELMKEPGGGVPELCENLAQYIFGEQPEPESIAPQLARFWDDLPDELAQGFYSQMGAAALVGDDTTQKANKKYMHSLTIALQAEDGYNKVNERLNATHDMMERALKGGGKKTDPMS